MRISTKKIRKFQKDNSGYWHEGLNMTNVRDVKRNAEGRYNFLFSKFYWQKGKSYVIQDVLGGHTFCISKKTYDIA